MPRRSRSRVPFSTALVLGAYLGACTGPNPEFEPEADAAIDLPIEVAPWPDTAPGQDSAPELAAPDLEAPEAAPEIAAEPVAEVAPEAPPEVGPDLAPERPLQSAQLPEAACGDRHADLTGITRADGVAIDRDGTLYYSTDDGTDGFIGRLVDGRTLTTNWQTLRATPFHTGLALDALRRKLYVAVKTTANILVYDLAKTPVTREVYTNLADDVNDLALAPDGTLFVSLQGRGHVYNVRNGAVALLTLGDKPIGNTAVMQGPAGLAWSPGGELFVGMAHGGPITRIRLTANYTEAGRSSFGGWSGWGNGLAFDETGRLYVGVWSNDTATTKVVRLNADGTQPSDRTTAGNFASLAFGRGVLSCTGLYVANPSGPMRLLVTDAPGLRQP